MTLSFCIPTYNRLRFLQKNITILMQQIKEEGLEKEVEICISDNHATDGTEEYCRQLVDNNQGITITYKRNEENLGPDRNFLSAMHMAKGEYSMLWGDDDFLHKGGLRRIFELIAHGRANDIQIMLSSTNVIDAQGKQMFVKNFLREDIKEYTVDFSKPEEARSYFFLVKDMGGLLSFISDVIYKTSIIEEIPFDDCFIGTHYAFLCYWWGYLAKGKKMYYSSVPFLDETYQYQPAYGYGVDRLLVDYHGFTTIAGVSFQSGDIDKADFLQCFQMLHPLINQRIIRQAEPSLYDEVIKPKLSECGLTNDEYNILRNECSFKSNLKSFFYCILPESLVRFIKDKKKR